MKPMRPIVPIVSAVIVGLLTTLLAQAYQRGAWQERARDLAAQVQQTDSLLRQHTADSTAWARTLAQLAARSVQQAKDSTRLAGQLADASRERRAADSAAAVARAGVVEADLPAPVLTLVTAERRAAAAARDEATVCQAGLTNAQAQRSTCEESKGTFEGEIASLERLRSRLVAERDSARALLKPPPLLSLTLELGAGVGCASNGQETVCGGSVHGTLLRFRIPVF